MPPAQTPTSLLAQHIHTHIADLAVLRALVAIAVKSTLLEELSGVVAVAVLRIGKLIRQVSLIARKRQVKHPASD